MLYLAFLSNIQKFAQSVAADCIDLMDVLAERERIRHTLLIRCLGVKKV